MVTEKNFYVKEQFTIYVEEGIEGRIGTFSFDTVLDVNCKLFLYKDIYRSSYRYMM